MVLYPFGESAPMWAGIVNCNMQAHKFFWHGGNPNNPDYLMPIDMFIHDNRVDKVYDYDLKRKWRVKLSHAKVDSAKNFVRSHIFPAFGFYGLIFRLIHQNNYTVCRQAVRDIIKADISKAALIKVIEASSMAKYWAKKFVPKKQDLFLDFLNNYLFNIQNAIKVNEKIIKEQIKLAKERLNCEDKETPQSGWDARHKISRPPQLNDPFVNHLGMQAISYKNKRFVVDFMFMWFYCLVIM